MEDRNGVVGIGWEGGKGGEDWGRVVWGVLGVVF